jgi:hypothetical protein
MSRHRTPTEVLTVRGSFRKHPERLVARGNTPTSPDVGEPPECLSDEQREAWKYIVSRCPRGVLRRSDEVALEIAARLFTKMRAGTIDPPGLRQLDVLIGKFGMNPLERQKVPVTPKPKENRFTGSIQ